MKRPPLATVALSIVAGVAASFAITGPSQSFLGAAVSSLLVALTPGSIVTVGITQLGDLASVLVFAGALTTVLLYAIPSLFFLS